MAVAVAVSKLSFDDIDNVNILSVVELPELSPYAVAESIPEYTIRSVGILEVIVTVVPFCNLSQDKAKT